jgi:hypothetical protein
MSGIESESAKIHPNRGGFFAAGIALHGGAIPNLPL